MIPPSSVLRKRAGGAEYLAARGGRRKPQSAPSAAIAGDEGDKASVSRRGGAEQRDKASGRGKRSTKSAHGSPPIRVNAFAP